jgi:hypothetical protein
MRVARGAIVRVITPEEVDLRKADGPTDPDGPTVP